jgi:hypothetical protein
MLAPVNVVEVLKFCVVRDAVSLMLLNKGPNFETMQDIG